MEQPQTTVLEDNIPSSPDSWIDLGSRGTCSEAATPPHMFQSGIMQQLAAQAMEKLLADAQRDGGGSGTISRGSAVSPPLSPINMGSIPISVSRIHRTDTDWMWDWSSRMEKSPPSGYVRRLRHPSSNASSAEVDRVQANSDEKRQTSPWSWENLPTLIITHASTFLLGAALVFFAMKKHWNMKLFAIHPID